MGRFYLWGGGQIGDLLIDVDVVGSTFQQTFANVASDMALALEAEKKELQPSKSKGLDATVLRFATPVIPGGLETTIDADKAEQAESKAGDNGNTTNSSNTDGRGDYAIVDPEAPFARSMTVPVGGAVLTLDCATKKGMNFRIAEYEGYAVYVKHSETSRLPLESGDVLVAVLSDQEVYDFRGRPATVVARYIIKCMVMMMMKMLVVVFVVEGSSPSVVEGCG